ncbi:MAG: HNH endonuclease [Pyrinomonadaceae bacterium]|nr:HNH endonuclease [Pyrinomonadaceae bacterium]
MSRYKSNLTLDDIYPSRTDHLCRRCEKPLTGKQTKWCSKDCSYAAFEEMMFAKGSSTHIRREVFARDNGICANCGIDCEKIQRISDHANQSLSEFETVFNPYDLSSNKNHSLEIRQQIIHMFFEYRKQFFKDARKIWKDTPLNFGGSCWQADHILEVIHGGKHEMSNLQTLCNLCHKQKTAKMARPKKINQATLF